MGKNFFKQLGKVGKSAGNWIKNAAEDTFHWTENTVGKVGNRLLDHSENQLSSITGVFNNPSFLIVAGVIVVALILTRK